MTVGPTISTITEITSPATKTTTNNKPVNETLSLSRSSSPSLLQQTSSSLFKPPSLPSSRSFPSLVTLASLSSYSPSSSPSSSYSSLFPSNVDLRRACSEFCRLGNSCFSSRDFDGAIINYTQALDLNYDDPRTWNNRGTCYVAKKLFRMGIRDYDEAISRLPACGEFYYHRGVAYSALKKYADAIQDYTRCIELHASHANAYNNRGNAYRIQRQYSLAKQDLQQAVQLEPTSQLYQKNLKRVEMALSEEAKSGKSAMIMDLEAILHQILLPRGARDSHPAFITVTSQLESLLRTLIENTKPKNENNNNVETNNNNNINNNTVNNVNTVTSSTQTTPTITVKIGNESIIPPLTDSPLVANISSNPSSPSSAFSLASPHSPSMSAVIARLPPQLINSLLQLVQEKRVAMKEFERRREGKKRLRDDQTIRQGLLALIAKNDNNNNNNDHDSDSSDDNNNNTNNRFRSIKRVRVSTDIPSSNNFNHLYDNDDGSVDEEVGLSSPQSNSSSESSTSEEIESPRQKMRLHEENHSEPIAV